MANGAFDNSVVFFPAPSNVPDKLVAVKPAKTASFDPDLTFTGPANRTRVNEDGTLETLSANQAAFDFSRTDKCGRLTMPPAVTNNALDSDDTNTNFTTGSNLTAVASTIFGHDAIEITATGTGAITATTEQHSRVINIAYSAGQKVTFSFYAKKSGSHAIAGYLLETSTQSIGGYFNLDTLATGSLSAGVATDSRSRKVTALRDDIFLCEETLELTGAETFTLYSLAPTDASAVVTSGNEMIFALPQLENYGAATPRIITTTSAVTRTQSDWLKSSFNEFWASTEFTIVIKGLFYDVSKGNQFIQIFGTTASNRIQIGLNSSQQIQATIIVGGSTSALLNGGTLTSGEEFTLAVRAKEDDFYLALNGTEIETDTNGAMFASDVLETIQSSAAGALDWEGELSFVMVDWVGRSNAYCLNLSNL